MQAALMTTFAVTKKEPLAVLLERIHAAFLAAGLGEPSIIFRDCIKTPTGDTSGGTTRSE